jgi:hypothetical protein
VLVVDDPLARDRGHFSVIAPKVAEGGTAGERYGLEDESGRLNLNLLLEADKVTPNGGRQLLMGLPGMTESIADAILDWLDPDDDQREFGAEVDYYSGLSPPYAPKNGPLDTVEELLLVRGVTPELLFGADANRNGKIDPGEQGSAAPAGGNSDQQVDRGWWAYLTLHSAESNLRPDGRPRINLNGSDLSKLYDDLTEAFGEQWATFIVAYRQFGPSTAKQAGQKGGTVKLDFQQPAKSTFSTVLDLVGPQVQVKQSGSSQPITLETPFPDDPTAMANYLPQLMDHATISSQGVIPGRININEAPKAVLQGIPGMTEDIVAAIIAHREPEPSTDNPGRRHETWLLTEGIVSLDDMKRIMPFITAGGQVFRAQIVGYFEEQGPVARIEAVVDATTQQSRIVFWRDLSHLGRGYPLETLGIDARE